MKLLDSDSRYVLTLEAASMRGQVAAITEFLESEEAYIEEFAVFDDQPTCSFYVRAQFRAKAACIDLFRTGYQKVLSRFHNSKGSIYEMGVPVRAIVMVSKTDHCLRELVTQIESGGLNLQIVAVVSNHALYENYVKSLGVPFHQLTVTPENKLAQEEQLLKLYEKYNAEYILLARYMQILSDSLCKRLHGKIVNIHHSFLPGFKGARPYQQAYDRGVKLIGATAHFATSDLDEGPIVEQELQRVDHTYSPAALLNVGRTIESMVFARAARLIADRRVFINGLRTIVLR